MSAPHDSATPLGTGGEGGVCYDPLKLDNQICFPLYACAREVVKRYKPFLDEIELTYTQYVTMMVMWEAVQTTSKDIGERLHLDSGTLTPVIKKLADKGLVTRRRAMEDERNLLVTLTDEGRALRERALSIPERVCACMDFSLEEAAQLHGLLRRLLSALS